MRQLCSHSYNPTQFTKPVSNADKLGSDRRAEVRHQVPAPADPRPDRDVGSVHSTHDATTYFVHSWMIVVGRVDICSCCSYTRIPPPPLSGSKPLPRNLTTEKTSTPFALFATRNAPAGFKKIADLGKGDQYALYRKLLDGSPSRKTRLPANVPRNALPIPLKVRNFPSNGTTMNYIKLWDRNHFFNNSTSATISKLRTSDNQTPQTPADMFVVFTTTSTTTRHDSSLPSRHKSFDVILVLLDHHSPLCLAR